MSVYRAGYRDSTKDIYQSIMGMEGIDHSIKCRILSNLANNVTTPQPPQQQHFQTSSSSSSSSSSPPPSPTLSEGSAIPSPPLNLYNAPQHQRPHHYINTPSQYLTPPSFLGARPNLPPLIRSSSTVREITKEEKSSDVWRPW